MHVPAELTLGDDPEAVPEARRFTTTALGDRPDVALDAEIVVSELVTNAVLHGQAPILLRLTPFSEGVRIEVQDSGRTPPILVRPNPDTMTGRGLSMVSALADRWGVDAVPDNGKVVWAEVGGAAAPAPSAVPEDIEALLAAWSDEEEPSESDPIYTVRLGPVATDLLSAAKAHIDNVVRELTLLREGEAAGGAPLPDALSELVEVVTGEFSAARAELKRQAAAAGNRGHAFTEVVLHVPASLAEAGERYLAALEQADRYARSAQLLTVAPPLEHQIFRRWYVTSLTEQLRARARGETPPPVRPYQLVLGDEVARMAPLVHISARLELLQRVNRRLAAVSDPVEMARIVVDEALTFLEVETARVRLLGPDGALRSVAWKGRAEVDREGLTDYRIDSDLPGAVVARTGRPLFLRSLSETFNRYPELLDHYPANRSGHIMPLAAGGRTLGILNLTFTSGRLSGELEVEFVAALADALAEALARAELAAADEQKRETLAFLAEASQILTSAQDPNQVLKRFVELAVPRLADWCSVYVPSEDGTWLRRAAMAIRGLGDIDRFERMPLRLDEDLPHARAFLTGRPQPIPVGIGALLEKMYPGLDFAALGGDEGASGICLPIVLRSEVIGVIGVTFMTAQRTVTPAVIDALEGLAARTAVALDDARRWLGQTQLVQSLVSALLPSQPPEVPGIEFAARYLPAAGDVAGDWWEATPLTDGTVLVGLGDAAGHGVAAVSDMCELRYGARALAAVDSSPAALLTDLNRRLDGFDAGLATAVYGRLEPGTGELRWASAGHVPPLHIHPDGGVDILSSPAGTPLGSPGNTLAEATLVLEPGATLVLYSDGVVERRDRDLTAGIEALAATAGAHAGRGGASLDALADAVFAAHCVDPVDDCCLLLIRRSLS